MSFPLRVLTPERTLVEADAQEVTLRTEGGDIAFLTGHVPFVGVVRPSPCTMQLADGSTRVAALHGGLVEMGRHGCLVLAPVAELAGDIDAERARAAESRLSGSAEDDEAAQAALGRARLRIAVAQQG